MRVHEESAAMEEILWRESRNVYHPARRPLAEFLSTINLVSGPESLSVDHPLLVFLEQDCADRVTQHAERNILREQAGILCGQAYQSDEQNYVMIESAIAADTLADGSHFRFQQDSWQDVWVTLSDSQNIIGWYHTHPGLGVFLSATDMRTQQLYFSSPWQIAMVIDPVSRETGLFYGSLGVRIEEDSCFTYIRKTT